VLAARSSAQSTADTITDFLEAINIIDAPSRALSQLPNTENLYSFFF
jgi:hypothetical protein